ncbi:GNAT family N-acetyltransferase [Kitasatospora sp. NPDC002040]|uniref:GNAT family N-acetyltransferase n=1 Tax=Kitasatospora sp. NPDC002040 TaxID=3154661 RepID=UPI00332F2CD2
MTWTLSDSPDDFRAQAGDFLAAHRAENTVLLTVLHSITTNGPHVFGPDDPQFGWWRPAPDAPVAGAFLRTPPYALRLGRMPERAGAELALALAGVELPGIGGGLAQATAFAAARPERSTLMANERLYRLGELVDPSPLPGGRVRPATAADADLLVEWFSAFVAEAELAVPGENHRPTVERRTAAGDLHVWEDEEGVPVSFAAVSAVIGGMSRIGPVYTPPEHRGRGYASGVVAAGSAHALAAGADEVLLFTDLANPTSNSIYRKLGYRPVEDCVSLSFEA